MDFNVTAGYVARIAASADPDLFDLPAELPLVPTTLNPDDRVPPLLLSHSVVGLFLASFLELAESR